jgi:hypothetical protein
MGEHILKDIHILKLNILGCDNNQPESSGFPGSMLKTHLVELSFHQNLRKLLKVSSRSVMNSSWLQVLTTMSSM